MYIVKLEATKGAPLEQKLNQQVKYKLLRCLYREIIAYLTMPYIRIISFYRALAPTAQQWCYVALFTIMSEQSINDVTGRHTLFCHGLERIQPCGDGPVISPVPLSNC